MTSQIEKKEKYKEDLAEIKEIMTRSSRFTALSGISGILAGIPGLAGGYLILRTLQAQQIALTLQATVIENAISNQLLIIAFCTLLLAKVFIFYFTSKRMKSIRASIKDRQTQRLMFHLFIPMLAGGLIIIKLIINGYLAMSIASTLIFYGLGLINASKFTLDQMRSLGILQVLLGVIAMYFPTWSLLIWMVGFGILHIVYGSFMHFNYRA